MLVVQIMLGLKGYKVVAMTIFLIGIFSLIGLIAGFLSGLLGIGGGIIVVPCLFYVMHIFFPSSNFTMQLSAANALAAMVVTTFFSMMAHKKRAGIKWSLVKKMLIGIVLGSFLGVFLTQFFKSLYIERFFGFFLIVNSLSFIASKDRSHLNHHKYISPSPLLASIVGASISSLSAILGIGGGVLSVQFFQKIHLNIKKSIATASVLSFFVSLCGSIFYVLLGKNSSLGSLNGLAFSLGPIYIPAFGLISLFSAISAPFGAKLVHALDTTIIKKIFGGVTLTIGIYMIARTYI
jgi:uncharacterized membrane protein YfcA